MINSESARAWRGDESQVIHQCKGGKAVPPPRSIITTQKEIDLDKIYDQKDNPSIFKPLGLWYAIGDSWYKYWYKNHLEMKNLPKNLNIFKLSIRKNSFTTDIKNPNPNKILRIKTNNDVILFTKLYCIKPYKKLSGTLLKKEQFSNNNWEMFKNIYHDDNIIDWQKVSKKFGGIEFNPYINQVINPIKNGKKPILINWYTTVDIPSGCIWNLKPIINNIEKMKRSELSANLKNIYKNDNN
jgi:hypothetical protein